MERSEPTPVMKFTASEHIRIVSDNGAYVMIFEPGQTRRVVKPLWSAAVRAGLVPADPDVKTPELPPEPEKPRKVGEDEKKAKLIEAAKELIAKQLPEDFTVTGKLRTASVKKLVDFDFTARDVQDAYDEALHEVRSSGNDDSELVESRSLSTE